MTKCANIINNETVNINNKLNTTRNRWLAQLCDKKFDYSSFFCTSLSEVLRWLISSEGIKRIQVQQKKLLPALKSVSQGHLVHRPEESPLARSPTNWGHTQNLRLNRLIILCVFC